jgi:hypothetical protein
MPVDLDREAQKEAIKEAISEWLDAQVVKFGWLTLKTLACFTIAGVGYVYLITHGLKS